MLYQYFRGGTPSTSVPTKDVTMSTQTTRRIEIEEDPVFEARSWRFQRIGWAFLALILIISILGLTGSGPLNGASTQTTDAGLVIRYERFERALSPGVIFVSFAPEMVRDGEVRIWILSSYLENVQLEQVLPQPARVEVGEQRYVFTFGVSSTTNPTEVSFHIKPDLPGMQTAEIGIVDGPSRTLRQLVYP